MCGCHFNTTTKKWHFCNEAKRLLQLSKEDYSKRKDYDNHFKKFIRQ